MGDGIERFNVFTQKLVQEDKRMNDFMDRHLGLSMRFKTPEEAATLAKGILTEVKGEGLARASSYRDTNPSVTPRFGVRVVLKDGPEAKELRAKIEDFVAQQGSRFIDIHLESEVRALHLADHIGSQLSGYTRIEGHGTKAGVTDHESLTIRSASADPAALEQLKTRAEEVLESFNPNIEVVVLPPEPQRYTGQLYSAWEE